MDRWQKKIAVVTGASSGIGAACAVDLVKAGMIVVGLARREELIIDLRDNLSNDLQANLHSFKCDITKEENIIEAFNWIEANLGGISVLINNAGIARHGPLLSEINSRDFRQVFDTNVTGVVICTREAFRSMKAHNIDGHVVMVNSIAGQAVPMVLASMSVNCYPASKYALRAIAEIYRKEFAILQRKVKVTFSLVIAGNDIWPLERPDGMPNIVSLEVMCGKDHMDVHLTFSHPFEGIVSSKGQHSDPRCVYVPPSTGKTFFSFRISYSRCGTKPDLHGQFYENTVVVQYDKDLLEVWDEAKRLRCEWFNDYEKTASKPPMVIADLDVIQLDFRGDNVDCWMEIQHGKGPWAPPVNGIVPLGSTLTLVVAINDYRGEFDMRVKSCDASDGSGHIIKLSDEFGCVLRPKMISRFLKARAPDERATVITYAFFHAFKFPDALSVHIKCKVEICRHGCLDHCQLTNGNVHERKDVLMNDGVGNNNEIMHELPNNVMSDGGGGGGGGVGGGVGGGRPSSSHSSDHDHDIFYDDIIHNRKQLSSSINKGIANILDTFNMNEKNANLQPRPVHEEGEDDEADMDSLFDDPSESESMNDAQYMELKKSGKFPQGPRLFEAQKRMGVPMAGPRSLEPKTTNDDDLRPVYRPKTDKDASVDQNENQQKGTQNKPTNTSNDSYRHSQRRKRSIVISDRKVRSADVGVSGLYDVISEADLAFSPDTKQEAVTVFQGKIAEEVVYGICMPVPGFSILFIVVISATIVSALIAGSLLYRYQLQKEALEKQVPVAIQGTLASWMTLRLFRMRHEQQHQQHCHHQQQQQSVVASAHPQQQQQQQVSSKSSPNHETSQ